MYLKCIYVCIQISLIVGVDDHVALLNSTIYFNLIVHYCIIEFWIFRRKRRTKKRNFWFFTLYFPPSILDYLENWDASWKSKAIVLAIIINRNKKLMKERIYHLVWSPQEQWALMGHNVLAPEPTTPT